VVVHIHVKQYPVFIEIGFGKNFENKSSAHIPPFCSLFVNVLEGNIKFLW